MIKNRKLFIISLLFMLAFIIFNFPFPHAKPYGELILSPFNSPINFNFAAMISLLLLGLCLVSLMKSLNKFIGRAVIIAIFAAALLPPWIVEKYQQTLATGIYAVHYDPQASNCQFEKTSDETMLIQCDLAFENYSSNDVQFTVEFDDRYRLENDPIQELLQTVGPIKVTLPGNRSMIHINEELNISELNNAIDSGGGNGIAVTIQSEGKVRKL